MIQISINTLIDRLNLEALAPNGKVTIDFLLTLLSLDGNQAKADCVRRDSDSYLNNLRDGIISKIKSEYAEGGLELLKQEVLRHQQMPTIRERLSKAYLKIFDEKTNILLLLGEINYFEDYILKGNQADNVHFLPKYGEISSFQKEEGRKYLNHLISSLKANYQ